MQEYVLYGQVPSESRRQVLQQCAGVCRMQPQAVEELHLVFKAKQPPGLADMQKSSGGGAQGVVSPEIQKTRTMLNMSLYYVQLVGTVLPISQDNGKNASSDDMVIANGQVHEVNKVNKVKQLKWVLEFRDTPDPGKQPVSSRLLFKVPFLEGDVCKFVEDSGFEYISRYVVIGHKTYDQDTTLFLHRVVHSPLSGTNIITNAVIMPNTESLIPVDSSDQYVLSATIETVDGGNTELRDRAARQLLAMKETMKGAINLTPGDRLALDTKVPFVVGQRR